MRPKPGLSLGQPPLGGCHFTILFLSPVLRQNELWQQRQHLVLIWMHRQSCQRPVTVACRSLYLALATLFTV